MAYGLGAVLRQLHSDCELRAEAYASKTLTEAQKRYEHIEQVCNK